MSFELLSCLFALFFLAGVGTPIGYSILMASVVYLAMAGLDVALAGEKILQGFYKSTIPAGRNKNKEPYADRSHATNLTT